MANFFDQITNALIMGEATFGANFTLNNSPTTFRGVFTSFLPDSAIDLGEFDEEISATIMASKQQFVDAEVVAITGNRITYDSREFRILRISSDETSHEFVLREL